MNKKIFYILAVVAAAGLLALLIYSIAQDRQEQASLDQGFNFEDIDISQIGNDSEFASALPEYRILFNGLVKEEVELNLVQIIEKYLYLAETRIVHGVRSDGEQVDIEYTGLDLRYLLEDIEILDQAQNIIVYGTDLYAANFTLEELKQDMMLVWKKEGQYMVPSQDGVLKIVQHNGPTFKWVKNPVLFNIIPELQEMADESGQLDPGILEFASEQTMFVLTIGMVPQIDSNDWSLAIEGLVEKEMSLDYGQLKNMPQESVYATLETISNPQGGPLIGNAVWSGVPLAYIMDMVQYSPQTQEVVFYCTDGYSTSITLEEALQPGVMLAYAMNGRDLSAEHGFPVRAVVPSKYGMKWAKWIERIEFVDYDYKGYWESRGWSDYAGRDTPEQRFE